MKVLFRWMGVLCLCALTACSAEPVITVESVQQELLQSPSAMTPEPALDLNKATAAELMALDGIGEATAGNILAYREAHGPFQSVAELQNVKGIGEKTLAAIQPFLYVENEVAPAKQTKATVGGKNTAVHVNLNTADVGQLQTLDGIGPATAQKIVDYRTQNGGFQNIEQLLEVDGIGERVFAKVKAHVFVENPVYTAPPTEAPTPAPTAAGPVNLNTAAAVELEALPGIGPVLAERILAYRKTYGAFHSVDELLGVTGIKEATLEQCRHLIYVENTEALPTDAAKININTATADELMALPGIGEALAGRIITYREANGPFGAIEDLQKVAGIGEKRFSAIADQICAD